MLQEAQQEHFILPEAFELGFDRQTEISRQVYDGLLWNFAQTFMIARWWILQASGDLLTSTLVAQEFLCF